MRDDSKASAGGKRCHNTVVKVLLITFPEALLCLWNATLLFHLLCNATLPLHSELNGK